MPADSPPRRSSIKRLLLYFDTVIVPDASDTAVVTDHEIVENFPEYGVTVAWGPRGSFIRSEDYQEHFRLLKYDTASLQSRGIVRFQQPNEPGLPDAASRIAAWHTLVSDEALVRAAVPDVDVSVEYFTPDTVVLGAALGPPGYQSRYNAPIPREPFRIPEADGWSYLAWIRLGRAIKFIERSHFLGAIPFATDPPNAHLSVEIARRGKSIVAPEDAADAALALDTIDHEELEKELIDMSWTDVVALRRELLPHLGSLRDKVLRSVPASLLGDVSTYRHQLRSLRGEFNRARDELHEAWRALGFGALIKGTAAMTSAVGLETIFLSSSWGDTLSRLIAFGAVGGAALSGELNSVRAANRAIRINPLFHIDRAVFRDRTAG